MRLMLCIFAGVALAGRVSLALATGEPSFDCTKAHSTSETLICSDPLLSELDRGLARTYRGAKVIAPDRSEFEKQQQAAWKWRETNCLDFECLYRWFRIQDERLARFHDSYATHDGRSNCGHPLYVETPAQSVSRLRKVVHRFVQHLGESETELYRHLGSTELNVFAMILTAEDCGASAADALESLNNLATSLRNP